jgi:DNA-binding response OmpR family regulator
MRILVVEDDNFVAAGLQEGLEAAGYSVDRFASAESAENSLQLTSYDLCIIDIGLPAMSGIEWISRLRKRSILLPALILTARDRLEDRVKGLDIGADDYMTKPFMLPELLSRIRALIRRSRSAARSEFSFGQLTFNLATHSSTIGKQAIEFTPREWDILEHLILAAPNVVNKKKLMQSLSEWDNEITSNAIEIYVSRLRVKLEKSGILIQTVRGIGYRLDEPVQ